MKERFTVLYAMKVNDPTRKNNDAIRDFTEKRNKLEELKANVVKVLQNSNEYDDVSEFQY